MIPGFPFTSPNPATDIVAAVKSKNYQVMSSFQVWTQPTATTQPVPLLELGGGPNPIGIGQALAMPLLKTSTSDEDETRQIRRTCTVNLGGVAYSLNDLNDLFNPYAGNELRIYHGVFSDGGSPTLQQFPRGIYRMATVKMTDKGGAVDIVIGGSDRSFEVSRRQWRVPFQITAGTPLDEAMMAIFNDRFPGLVFNFSPPLRDPVPGPVNSAGWPSVAFTGSGPLILGSASGGDPMQDAVNLATNFGMEVYFDPFYGNVVLRQIPDPSTQASVWEFEEGDDCQMSEIDVGFDLSKVYNGVIVIGNGSTVADSVRAETWINDPSNPLDPSRYGYVPYFYSTPLVTHHSQALATGQAILQRLLRGYGSVGFTAPPVPWLEVGDVVSLKRSRIGVQANYCLSSFNYPFDLSQMTVSTRAAVPVTSFSS